jgi:DNA replication protein DnaC
MLDTHLMERLAAIGLRIAPDAMHALVAHVTKSNLSFVQGLEQLVEIERRERDARNLQMRLKTAKLGTVSPLAEFDWHHPRKINRALYEQLLDMQFVEQHQNVLLRGPSGVGKTMLALNLGLTAIQKGYVVRFESLASALADLLRQESLPATQRRLRLYTRPDVLILDEVGYLPCDSKAADMLFNIITERHEAKSTIVTTNMSFKQWGTLFQGAACLPALVDRFAQHCHMLDIDADSWRKKTALDPQK